MAISRTADYAIQGFIYQFNKTLDEILSSSDDATVTVEGIIEDIVVSGPTTTKAIQCKYHEASGDYTLSSVYKPILQMLYHFHDNSTQNIEYILFCHFPNKVGASDLVLTTEDLQQVLQTTNDDLKKITSKLTSGVDVETFSTKFKIVFGDSFPGLANKIKQKLEDTGLSKEDVEDLFYPNAVHTIALLSTRHNEIERKITKVELLAKLKSIKTTAISRWTLALTTYRRVLDAKRRQLKPNLGSNTRLRYFILKQCDLSDFDEQIVSFIKDFLSKYHFKPAHTQTPMFCLDTTTEIFDSIRLRIHQKGIKIMDGFIGTYFDKAFFLKEPICNYPRNKEPEREFDIRLIRYTGPDEAELFNTNKCDDLYVVSATDYVPIVTQDINYELLQLNKLSDLKYLLGLSDIYE